MEKNGNWFRRTYDSANYMFLGDFYRQKLAQLVLNCQSMTDDRKQFHFSM